MMKVIVTTGVIAFLGVMLVLSVGCVSRDFEYGADKTTEVCPDESIYVDRAVLTSTLGEDGLPLNTADSFAADTSEIFCVFWLSDDLCCKVLSAKWLFPDRTAIFWDKEGVTVELPDSTSITQPEGGFPPGDYLLSIYVETREVFSLPFTVI